MPPSASRAPAHPSKGIGQGTAAEEFPPFVLRDYAFAGDGERGMLIGPRGDIAWLCAPHWDSDAVFATLIGGRGVYAVTPTDPRFVWGGQYEPGSLIWRNRWVTSSHIIECRDALAYPADPSQAVILRRILGGKSETTVTVVLDPRAGFGKHPLRELTLSGDTWTARTGTLHLRWTGAAAATHTSSGALRLDITIPAGTHHDLVLEIADRPLRSGAPNAENLWDQTVAAWADSTTDVTNTVADRDARHAVTVLRGLTSAGGGMVAGATMSLPERYESNRNYDYRYAWIRDQCYAGQAAALTGQESLVDAAVEFVTARLLDDGPEMKPAYTVDGAAVPDEHPLKLAGYPGGSDKAGNWVNTQFQLDAFGEALSLFAAAARIGRLSNTHWRAVETAVAAIEKRHREPDAGIWELDNEKWAHSRLACVAGLRNIATYAPATVGARWAHLADSILAETAAESLHPTGRWQRTPTDTRIDSALLIPAVRGALPADDPRTTATLNAALSELGDEGYMYRYQQDGQPLGRTEGAFLLCGFMTSLALHQSGRAIEAARWFERNRAACGTPGLFSEEFDAHQRQLRGNLPQAFVHALLLETAHTLAT